MPARNNNLFEIGQTGPNSRRSLIGATSAGSSVGMMENSMFSSAGARIGPFGSMPLRRSLSKRASLVL